MCMNFILFKRVRQTYYLCSEVALYNSSREGNKMKNRIEKTKETNESRITYLVDGPSDGLRFSEFHLLDILDSCHLVAR